MEPDDRCSPLATVIACLSIVESQWLADAIFLSGPITNAAGCRLILSVRKAASHQLTSASKLLTMNTFVVRDEPWEDVLSVNSGIEL